MSPELIKELVQRVRLQDRAQAPPLPVRVARACRGLDVLVGVDAEHVEQQVLAAAEPKDGGDVPGTRMDAQTQ